MNSVFKNALVWVMLGSALIFIFNNVENASSSKREMISYSQYINLSIIKNVLKKLLT